MLESRDGGKEERKQPDSLVEEESLAGLKFLFLDGLISSSRSWAALSMGLAVFGWLSSEPRAPNMAKGLGGLSEPSGLPATLDECHAMP